MIESAPTVRNYGYNDYEGGTLDFRQAVGSSVQTGPGFFGADGLNFWDVLDAVNPLQHLPIVGAVYRSLTGDQISTGARMAGGVLFGGPLGFAAALADSAVQDATGQDLGGTMLAWVQGEEKAAPTGDAVALAAAAPETARTTSPEAGDAATPDTAATALAAASPPSAAAYAAGTSLPQLSPQAFEALMRSLSWETSAPPAPAGPSAAPELSEDEFDTMLRSFDNAKVTSPEADAAPARDAAMELHETLRHYSQAASRDSRANAIGQ